MKYSNNKIAAKSQWQQYQQLELIPNSVPEPQANKIKFAFGLDRGWRLLVVALTKELVYEQQIEYIQRCWELSCFDSNSDATNTWQQLWTLMN